MGSTQDTSVAQAPALQTERLTLRPLTPADLGTAHRVFTDAAVRRHLFDDESVSIETARSLLRRSAGDFEGGSVGLFGIRPRGSEDIIGFCGFFVVEGAGEPELTYGLLPTFWGNGYATEAALAVARHAIQTAGFRRVIVAADAANVASMRVIERLGATRLGGIMPAYPEVVYFELSPNDDEPAA